AGRRTPDAGLAVVGYSAGYRWLVSGNDQSNAWRRLNLRGCLISDPSKFGRLRTNLRWQHSGFPDCFAVTTDKSFANNFCAQPYRYRRILPRVVASRATLILFGSFESRWARLQKRSIT